MNPIRDSEWLSSGVVERGPLSEQWTRHYETLRLRCDFSVLPNPPIFS